MRKLMVMVLCLLVVANAHAQQPEKVTDFVGEVATGDENVLLSLRFVDIRDMPRGGGADVVAQLRREGGKWADKGHDAAAAYNQRSSNEIKLGDVRFDGKTLKGRIEVVINPDKPRPGGGGGGPHPFPDKPDKFAITIDAKVDRDKAAPFIRNEEIYRPPWRNDTPEFGGDLITGTYTAVRDGKETKGKIIGALSPLAMDGKFGTSGNMRIKPANGGGMKVLARLAPQRVADKYHAAAYRYFDKAQDWTRCRAVRITVENDARRNDVAIDFGICLGKGNWRYVDNAALLMGGTRSYDVLIDSFTDGPVDDVTGIGIRVANPHGVGDVAFTVKKIELIPGRRDSSDADPGKPITTAITVDPDTVRSFNGVTDVPKGLFGGHDVNGPEHRGGKRAKRVPDDVIKKHVEYMRRINPGYFRPLTHTGFGARTLGDDEVAQRLKNRPNMDKKPDSVFVERALAGNGLDNVVWCHTVDLFARPAWMNSEKGPEEWANKLYHFYRDLASRAWVPGDKYNVMRKFEVWNEPFFWGRHMNKGNQTPGNSKDWQDPTQYGYIPGKLGADVYSEFFLAAVKGAKSANPHVLMGGPSAPAFSGDSYGVLDNYVRHFIDKCHDKIDFFTEHHYGGMPESYAASFEVITAYTDVKYDRRIPVYNTEANHSGGDTPDEWRAQYNVRDILGGIVVCPDKYRARAIHAFWSGFIRNKGVEQAYTMMNDLRGRILVTDSSDWSVTVVATTPEEGRLVVMAFNRGSAQRDLTLPRLDGFKHESTQVLLGGSTPFFKDLGDTEGQDVGDLPRGKTALVWAEDKAGKPVKQLVLPPRSGVVWRLSKDGYEPTKTKSIDQHFVDAVLVSVEPDEPVSGAVKWRGKKLAGAKAATLRVVTDGVETGEAVVTIGKQKVTLPRSFEGVVQELPLDVAQLNEKQAVTFEVADPKSQNGYKLRCASILIER